jgi:GNAT superfamily N-acetyltransferase
MVIGPATEAERREWLSDWRSRLRSWYGRPDAPPGWAAQQAEVSVSMFRSPGSELIALLAGEEDRERDSDRNRDGHRDRDSHRDRNSGRDSGQGRDGGSATGMLAVSLIDQNGTADAMLCDLWIAPAHRGTGNGARALRLAEEWAREHRAGSLWMLTDPGDPGHAALFARYPIRAQRMISKLDGPGELAAGLEGRPMAEAEYAAWRAGEERGYAADATDSGSMSAGEAAAAAAAEFDRLLPDGLCTPGHSFLCLCSGGEVVATNWLLHHRDPGVSWVYAVQVREQFRGRGYGRAAMVIGERAALGAGDTHVALNVFGHNHVAIGLYSSMGYRAYDHGRSLDL